MRKARLNPDGTVDVLLFEENEDTIVFSEYGDPVSVTRLTNDDILKIMTIYDIDIEKATVRSVIRMMDRYPVLAHVEDFSLSYMEEAKDISPFHPVSDIMKLDSIEISESFDVREQDHSSPFSFEDIEGSENKRLVTGKPYKHDMNNATHDYSASGVRVGDPDRYSLTYTPLDQIINLKITIGDTYVMSSHSLMFAGNDNGKSFRQYNCKKCKPTLMDIFQAIMVELTFLGNSQHKSDSRDELEETISEIESAKEKDEES